MYQTISNNKLQYYRWHPFDYTEEIILKETLTTRMSALESQPIDDEKNEDSQHSCSVFDSLTLPACSSHQSGNYKTFSMH
jgi:hypothetical protein